MESERFFSPINQRTGVDYRRKVVVQDWRSRLFTVFVDNLSHRVPKGALWEAFCDYGKVMDVYIPLQRKLAHKDSIFGFVRYKQKTEMMKAITNGNNRKIDGRLIKVKKASYGWMLRSFFGQSRVKKRVVDAIDGKFL